MITLRPSTALGRYHLLSGVRSSNGVFAVTFLLALLPLLVRVAVLEQESMLATWGAEVLTREAAQTVVIVYIIHLVLLLLASALVTSPKRRSDSRELADLIDTVPITPLGRFLGDMFGALACTLAIHLCTLPVLALTVVLSPVSSSFFWWSEVLFLAFMILGAAGAAWKRQMSGAWGRARTAGSVALFGTLVIAIFAATTRWEDFRDALAYYLSEPSPLRWSQMAREVMSPPLLATMLFVVYAGFLVGFAMQSVRFLERRQQ